MPVRLGILADSDQQDREIVFQSLHQKRAEEIMTRPAVTIEEDKLLSDAVAVMIGKNLKRLPVVDPAGRLTGMLSRGGRFSRHHAAVARLGKRFGIRRSLSKTSASFRTSCVSTPTR